MGEFIPYFTYRKKTSDSKVKELTCGFVENEYGELEELVCKLKVDGEEVGYLKMRSDEEEGIVVEEEGIDLINDEDLVKKVRDIEFYYKTKRKVFVD